MLAVEPRPSALRGPRARASARLRRAVLAPLAGEITSADPWRRMVRRYRCIDRWLAEGSRPCVVDAARPISRGKISESELGHQLLKSAPRSLFCFLTTDSF